MRTIKFRARDTEGKWIYSNPMPDMGFWKWVQYDSTTIFNEWTGLKDKNGVDIYEGDILKSNDGSTQTVSYYQREARFVCVDTVHGGLYDIHTTDDAKAIGNIYENPELLTKETI